MDTNKFESVIGSLTMKEWGIIETKSGQGMAVLGSDDPSTPRALFLTAIAYIIKKREDVTFSWSKAENMTFEELNETLGLQSPEDSTED